MSEHERSVSERIKAAMQNQACTDDLARVNRSPDDCPVGCPIHSGCDCHSGNNPDGKRPAFMVERNGRMFGIDACIAPAVQALWAAGIKTVNSCCGHNRFAPWIVLGEGEEVYRAAEVVRAVDSRLFAFDFARHDKQPSPQAEGREEGLQREELRLKVADLICDGYWNDALKAADRILALVEALTFCSTTPSPPPPSSTAPAPSLTAPSPPPAVP